jgi:hypothetical protein
VILVLIGVFAYLSLVPPETDAIPAFARRYKMSCSTCHAPFPRLKAYGEEFAGNGFYIPEEEKERDYVTAGDPLLWLNKTFPVAVRFELYGVYNDASDVDADLQTPWGVKLLSGGPIAKNIGYYFYFYMSERGEVAGVEDAYIHFNNLFGAELDVMVGQFQASDPLMKRELRLTFEDYEAYKKRIGESRVNLAYERGVMLPFSISRTGTDIVAMVVNGNGIVEAGEDREFDEDKYKNFGLRVLQGIGDALSLGGFAYYGKEAAPEDEPLMGGTNETVYFGGDARFSLPQMAFTGQYLYRKDQNPYFWDEGASPVPYPMDLETNSLIAELVLSPDLERSRWYFTALYNWIDSDDDSADYETGTLNATYVLARNIRLLAEYTHDFGLESNRGVFGIASAF